MNADLPRPWFSESLTDYARRCALPEHAVREHWDRELRRTYAEWRARKDALAPPEEIP